MRQGERELRSLDLEEVSRWSGIGLLAIPPPGFVAGLDRVAVDELSLLVLDAYLSTAGGTGIIWSGK
jgi:hypothetical protein